MTNQSTLQCPTNGRDDNALHKSLTTRKRTGHTISDVVDDSRSECCNLDECDDSFCHSLKEEQDYFLQEMGSIDSNEEEEDEEDIIVDNEVIYNDDEPCCSDFSYWQTRAKAIAQAKVQALAEHGRVADATAKYQQGVMLL